MNKSLKNLEKERKSREKKNKKNREQIIPEFDLNGKVINKEKKKIPKAPIIILLIIGLLAGSIYIPAINMADTDINVTKLHGDTSVNKIINQCLKDNPELDFDEDGLSNDLEAKYSTDPYRADSDNDRLYDYCELFKINTSPLSFDGNLTTYVKGNDSDAGKSTLSPYKMNDVVLWADNISSKSYGSVVNTGFAYEFSNFTGWAQFPVQGTAYMIDGDYLIPLEYRSNENAYKIEKACSVIVTQNNVNATNRLYLFNNEIDIGNNSFSKFVSTILPDKTKGFISCRYAGEYSPANSITSDIKAIDYDLSSYERFMRNDNNINNLANVIDSLKNNKCVLTSLYSEELGESIVIVYGYTSNGELLLANRETLEPVGKIKIKIRTQKVIDKNEVLKEINIFEFSGMGFDSMKKSYIRFLKTAD